MNYFTPRAVEEIKYYVYCLVDPLDGKVFYVGKGVGNRVFRHAIDAEVYENAVSEKLDKIREIHNRENGCNEVKYYIIRHGLTEEMAYEIESVLINFLTYEDFNLESTLTTIQAGHDEHVRGIKSVDEINVRYPCDPIQLNPEDFLLLVNVAGSLKNCDKVYDAAKGSWIMAPSMIKRITHVLAHSNGVVRGVFVPDPDKWSIMEIPDKKKKQYRVSFEGMEVENSPYMYADVRKYTMTNSKTPNKNPVTYLYSGKTQKK